MQPNQGFPGGSLVKNPPAKARNIIDVGSVVGQEDPLEEGMATRSSVLAWRIPWTEEPGGLQSMGSQRVRHNLATQMVKSLPAMRETWVRSLEKEMATHSSLLAWEIPWTDPWTEEPGGLQSMGSQSQSTRLSN